MTLDKAFIFGLIEARRDITLVEMAARLREEHAVEIGRSMLSRWLRQRGWTFKKRPHQYAFHHIFDRVCNENGIEHRLTKVKHPWANGQVERMNRTIKDATVKRFHYETHDQFRQHLGDFASAYNLARRLKTLRGLTLYEFICQQWQHEPSRFTQNPHHQTPGPNT